MPVCLFCAHTGPDTTVSDSFVLYPSQSSFSVNNVVEPHLLPLFPKSRVGTTLQSCPCSVDDTEVTEAPLEAAGGSMGVVSTVVARVVDNFVARFVGLVRLADVPKSLPVR